MNSATAEKPWVRRNQEITWASKPVKYINVLNYGLFKKTLVMYKKGGNKF